MLGPGAWSRSRVHHRLGVVPLLAAAAIGSDLVFRYAEDTNVAMPDALRFYPAIAVFVEIVLHVIPIAALVAMLGMPNGFDATFWRIAIPVALVEAVLQALYATSIGTSVFSAVDLMVFGVVQVWIFLRVRIHVDVVSLRLVDHALWHLAWGVATRSAVLLGITVIQRANADIRTGGWEWDGASAQVRRRATRKYVIMGVQGSGKGTQSSKLCEAFGLEHISVGDMFRWNIAHHTKLGAQVAEFADAGHLVSDDIVVSVVRDRLEQHDWNYGFVDGFPRQRAPGRVLFLESYDIDAVIVLDLPDEEVQRRVLSRRICSQCGLDYNLIAHRLEVADVCDVCGGSLEQRGDDTPEALARRLADYYAKT